MKAPGRSSSTWPLRETFEAARETVLENVRQALASESLSNGALVKRLEAMAAERCEASHCVGLASATTGLMLTVRALTENSQGVVLAPAFAFNATVLAPLWAGREVVCLPVDPGHMNLCVKSVERALEQRPVAAVIAIGVAGNLTGLEEVAQTAREAGVPFILDAAPCFGGRPHRGSLGTLADAAVISLSSRKLLSSGEGGMVLTSSAELAERLRRLRVYGSTDGFYCVERGLNARMSELHAAVALGCMGQATAALERRRGWAMELRKTLSELSGVALQYVSEGVVCSWNDVVVRVPSKVRDAIVADLRKLGVQAVPMYTPLIYRHPAFKTGCVADLQDREIELEALAQSVVAVPVLSTLDSSHLSSIADVFRAHLGP